MCRPYPWGLVFEGDVTAHCWGTPLKVVPLSFVFWDHYCLLRSFSSVFKKTTRPIILERKPSRQPLTIQFIVASEGVSVESSHCSVRSLLTHLLY